MSKKIHWPKRWTEKFEEAHKAWQERNDRTAWVSKRLNRIIDWMPINQIPKWIENRLDEILAR